MPLPITSSSTDHVLLAINLQPLPTTFWHFLLSLPNSSTFSQQPQTSFYSSLAFLLRPGLFCLHQTLRGSTDSWGKNRYFFKLFCFLLLPAYWLFFSNNYTHMHCLSTKLLLQEIQCPLVSINTSQSHVGHSCGGKGQKRPFYKGHLVGGELVKLRIGGQSLAWTPGLLTH